MGQSVQEEDIQFQRYDLDEIEQRKKEIQQIERDVLEVNAIVRDLDHLVSEQQEGINIMATNIESTKANTEGAHKELIQAETYQNAARRRMCCILILLVIALAIIIIPTSVVLSKK